MTNFYEKWLGFWDEANKERQAARSVIHEEELEWIETEQDFKVALMAGPENGFRTWGTEALISIIPVGAHTGKHEHGEEAIYVVEGEGFSVVNDMKYEWGEGSVIWVPFGGKHQHFNTGSVPVKYFSVMSLHLEHFVGLGKLDQHESKGYMDYRIDAPLSADGLDPMGRRIVLKKEDAPLLELGTEGEGGHSEPAAAGAQPKEVDWDNPDGSQGGHRDWTRMYMDRTGANGFKNKELELSNTMGDLPGRHGGKHAHMEAMLYIVDGEGYTVVDGVKVPWKKGSLLHVQGPQTPHQHFATGDKATVQLRFAPGIRTFFFQSLAKERFPYLWFEGRGDGA